MRLEKSTFSGSSPIRALKSLFQHEPFLVEKLKGHAAPWLFAYRVSLNEEAFYKAKGPILVEIKPAGPLNLNYILEHYSPKLGLLFEDLKLGDAYVTRFFIPALDEPSDRRVYVVGFYSDEPIDTSWYEEFEEIISTVEVQ